MILFLSKQIGERFMAVVKKIFNTNLLFNNDNHNDNNHKTFKNKSYILPDSKIFKCCSLNFTNVTLSSYLSVFSNLNILVLTDKSGILLSIRRLMAYVQLPMHLIQELPLDHFLCRLSVNSPLGSFPASFIC